MKTIFVIPMLFCLLTVAANFAANVQESDSNKQTTTAGTQETKPEAKQEPEAEVSLDDQFVAVDNMHHFMEYVCEPSYKGLKAVLAEEPADRRAWKAFKNHALVLAETSAMVAARGPKKPEESKQWKQISLDVHKHGTDLYKSAGKYEVAKKHYGLMIDQCNKCHTVFAEGKHQLAK